MNSSQKSALSVVTVWLLISPAAASSPVDAASLKNIANVSYAVESRDAEGAKLQAQIFSPRMDFDQWKPLTGRGDPLRNDPTYDYEPPLLERVHYWADETRLEREHYPERKSEVLMLGVSSRRPSVAPRQPPVPPRRHRPLPTKYEDFAYKFSEHYPMTILVPPPPPPPGHKPLLFTLGEETIPSNPIKFTESVETFIKETTTKPEHITSLYALQESNLIYQSSTTTGHTWPSNLNQTKPKPNLDFSSDYAGWGPTTPIDERDIANDTHNLILNDHDLNRHPYSFYKPILSEAPPPLRITLNPLLLPTFVPTVLPPTMHEQQPVSVTPATWPQYKTTTEITPTYNQDYYEDTTTEQPTTFFPPASDSVLKTKLESDLIGMLGPMMSMPLANGPDRPEDNLYAHASENVHIFREQTPKEKQELENMQTMQPPPVNKFTESPMLGIKYSAIDSPYHNKPNRPTHDPYLHMRFTTPMPSKEPDTSKTTTESPSAPLYLIIQGHSKVKTYGSTPKAEEDKHTLNNEIPKPNETNEVKHLHISKDKFVKKSEKVQRKSRAQDLKTLVNKGVGSIEIQDADVGITYDVSDGSEVPIEMYKKGFVENDKNNYISQKNKTRTRRRTEYDDDFPVASDILEKYVQDYLKRQVYNAYRGGIADIVFHDTHNTKFVDSADQVDDEEPDDDDDEDDDDEDDEDSER